VTQRIVLPRVIYGNRGDILSRWGLLNGLGTLGEREIIVFGHTAEDLPFQVRGAFLPYGKFHNLFLSENAKSALRNADRILWSCGLDITDESSQAKLLYLWFTFSQYHRLGKKPECVFQGLGPIKTRTGKILAKQVLKLVPLFIARDEHSYQLVEEINPTTQRILAGDAIFLPGFEEQIQEYSNPLVIEKYFPAEMRPIIAINMRRWFHLSSSLIPFQMAKKRYENRGQAEMDNLLSIYIELIQKLRAQYDARILLVSAYNPGVYSWEDDLPWLGKIKSAFPEDEEIRLMDEELPMVDYMALVSHVDLAISMRLHSSLTALRFGKPAINLSYSAKGVDVFHTLGLDDHAFALEAIMQEPSALWHKVDECLQDLTEEKKKVAKGVAALLEKNMSVLHSLFSNDHE